MNSIFFLLSIVATSLLYSPNAQAGGFVDTPGWSEPLKRWFLFLHPPPNRPIRPPPEVPGPITSNCFPSSLNFRMRPPHSGVRQAELDDAYSMAVAAMQIPACRDLIKGPNSPAPGEYTQLTLQRINMVYQGTNPTAGAGAGLLNTTLGRVCNISLYQKFYGVPGAPFDFNVNSGQHMFAAMTTTSQRASALLHEAAHCNGTNFHGELGPGPTDTAQARAFNETIEALCGVSASHFTYHSSPFDLSQYTAGACP